MKKIFIALAALIGSCSIVNLTSCKELEKAVKSIDKEQRADIITALITDGLAALTADSLGYMAGTWTFTDGKGTFDTLWIGRDSSIVNHFVSEDVDLRQEGGYLYYISYKQALVQYNSAYNYKTKKELQNWSNTIIYNVSKTQLSLLNMNQLTLEELDQQTGESQGSTTYTAVQ